MSGAEAPVPRFGWRQGMVFAVLGLVAGAAMTWGAGFRALPASCDELLYDSSAGAVLRTAHDPDLHYDDADGVLSCRWRAVRDPEYQPPRCATLAVEVERRPWLRPRGPVERLRAADGWRAQVTPRGLGVDAVVASRAARQGARAEARVVDDALAYTVTLACERADRATTAYLAEVTARQVVYGGRQP